MHYLPAPRRFLELTSPDDIYFCSFHRPFHISTFCYAGNFSLPFLISILILRLIFISAHFHFFILSFIILFPALQRSLATISNHFFLFILCLQTLLCTHNISSIVRKHWTPTRRCKGCKSLRGQYILRGLDHGIRHWRLSWRFLKFCVVPTLSIKFETAE